MVKPALVLFWVVKSLLAQAPQEPVGVPQETIMEPGTQPAPADDVEGEYVDDEEQAPGPGAGEKDPNGDEYDGGEGDYEEELPAKKGNALAGSGLAAGGAGAGASSACVPGAFMGACVFCCGGLFSLPLTALLASGTCLVSGGLGSLGGLAGAAVAGLTVDKLRPVSIGLALLGGVGPVVTALVALVATGIITVGAVLVNFAFWGSTGGLTSTSSASSANTGVYYLVWLGAGVLSSAISVVVLLGGAALSAALAGAGYYVGSLAE